MAIVPLAKIHCEAVASLHIQHLRSHFHGLAGKGLLRAYYAEVSHKKGACGYIAEREGKVVGYVCGVWDAYRLRHSLFINYWPALFVWGVIQILTTPSLIKDFLVRLLKPKYSDFISANGYELRPIVVSSSERGSGLAAQLVEALMVDARTRGYTTVYLITEDDNLAANLFYPKVHFNITGTLMLKGQLYNRYERTVNNLA